MKEQILELLKANETSFELSQIMDKIGNSDIVEVNNTLQELVDEGIVYRTKREKFMYFPYSHLKQGMLEVNKKGFGFVRTSEGDIYIDVKNINGAIHDDLVNVELISEENDPRKEGKIVKVVKRSLNKIVGEFYYEKDHGRVIPDDPRIKVNIKIKKEDCVDAVNGHKVLVTLEKEQNKLNRKWVISKIIGHKDDPKVDILSVAYKYGIKEDFSEEALEQLKTIPSSVSLEEIENRKTHDLRNQTIFTIDGDDTKDIDDAIGIEKLENGNYRLGVHIADVSNYVTDKSPLDMDACERGTSGYFANTVVPMLPHYLSNGICSLNPNVDRLSLSCIMEINQDGNVVDYEIFESVIQSRKQMTYKNVNKILEEGIIPEGYEPYVNDLHLMKELSDILRKSKIKRGYINFEQNEAKIVTDENGKPIDIKQRERGIGENMIEDFMIIANETVATFVFYQDLPFIYRIHEYPEEERINEFLRYVSILGYKLTGKRKDLHPKRIQEMLKELSDKPEYKILSRKLLRCMRKAIYSKENAGHYGLASKIYTHFTSPIRRYPDLKVHTILKEILNGKMTNDRIKYWHQELIYISEHSSERERAADDCEREVDDMKMAEYMMDHIGEEYDGIVNTVTNFGMFIELDNLVEGLVRLDDLTDDYYVYDEETFSLRGRNNKRGYRLGDRLRVKVKAASKEAKTIDFALVQKNEGEADGN